MPHRVFTGRGPRDDVGDSRPRGRRNGRAVRHQGAAGGGGGDNRGRRLVSGQDADFREHRPRHRLAARGTGAPGGAETAASGLSQVTCRHDVA